MLQKKFVVILYVIITVLCKNLISLSDKRNNKTKNDIKSNGIIGFVHLKMVGENMGCISQTFRMCDLLQRRLHTNQVTCELLKFGLLKSQMCRA